MGRIIKFIEMIILGLLITIGFFLNENNKLNFISTKTVLIIISIIIFFCLFCLNYFITPNNGIYKIEKENDKNINDGISEKLDLINGKISLSYINNNNLFIFFLMIIFALSTYSFDLKSIYGNLIFLLIIIFVYIKYEIVPYPISFLFYYNIYEYNSINKSFILALPKNINKNETIYLLNINKNSQNYFIGYN